MMDPDELVKLGEREEREEREEWESWQKAQVIDLNKRQRLIPDMETTIFLLKMSSFFQSTSTMWPADIVLRIQIVARAAMLANVAKDRRRSEYHERVFEQLKRTVPGNIMILSSCLLGGSDITSDPEAQAALVFLAGAIPLKLYPREREGLKERARMEDKLPAVVQRDVLVEALTEAVLRNRITTTYKLPRTGFRYRGKVYTGYLRSSGKLVQCAPIKLPFVEFYEWWFIKDACQLARNILGGREPTSCRVTSPNSPTEAEMMLARAPDMQTLLALLDDPAIEQSRTLLRKAGGSDKECMVWLLHKDLGLSSSEIARAIGNAPGTVRHQIHDMKRKLAIYLNRTPA
ncbi:MAG TPA: hypothetical protein VFU63_03105 [Ktedonobacterales bacterium]|nr:hypothetical protein [Ktedonobacterales bacterium]